MSKEMLFIGGPLHGTRHLVQSRYYEFGCGAPENTHTYEKQKLVKQEDGKVYLASVMLYTDDNEIIGKNIPTIILDADWVLTTDEWWGTFLEETEHVRRRQ